MGCLDFTETLPEEHLIVGYGYRYGKTTKVERLHHVAGEERSVSIPPYLREEIRRHHFQRTDAEVIIFHNHPRPHGHLGLGGDSCHRRFSQARREARLHSLECRSPQRALGDEASAAVSEYGIPVVAVPHRATSGLHALPDRRIDRLGIRTGRQSRRGNKAFYKWISKQVAL